VRFRRDACSDGLFDRENTHVVVDASHRRAVEDVEQRLFGDLDPNGPTLPGALGTATPVSDAVI
jgi:hypothetical protein